MNLVSSEVKNYDFKIKLIKIIIIIMIVFNLD